MADELEALERRWRGQRTEEAEAAYVAALTARCQAQLDDGPAHLRLGQMHWEAGRLDPAMSALRLAKRTAACAAEAGYLLGLCPVERKQLKLAVRELTEARSRLAAASQAAKETTYLLGRIHEAAGRSERALTDYEWLAGDDDRGDETPGALAALRPTDPPRPVPRQPSAQAPPEGPTA